MFDSGETLIVMGLLSIGISAWMLNHFMWKKSNAVDVDQDVMGSRKK